MFLVYITAKHPRTNVLTDVSAKFCLPEWISLKFKLKIPYFWSVQEQRRV